MENPWIILYVEITSVHVFGSGGWSGQSDACFRISRSDLAHNGFIIPAPHVPKIKTLRLCQCPFLSSLIWVSIQSVCYFCLVHSKIMNFPEKDYTNNRTEWDHNDVFKEKPESEPMDLQRNCGMRERSFVHPMHFITSLAHCSTWKK